MYLKAEKYSLCTKCLEGTDVTQGIDTGQGILDVGSLIIIDVGITIIGGIKMYGNYKKRKYQKTRYQVPNVLVPDELVMEFKRNSIHNFLNNNTRMTVPINGVNINNVDEYHNLVENMANFNTIEFLAGSVKVYFMRGQQTLEQPPWIQSGLIGSFTQRRWVDEEGSLTEDIEIPPITGENIGEQMWTLSSEIPGYELKFLPNVYHSKVTKSKTWKSSQSKWRVLKANPVEFQQKLPLVDPEMPVIPKNVEILNIDVDGLFGNPQSYIVWGLVSQKILVRFKGRNKL